MEPIPVTMPIDQRKMMLDHLRQQDIPRWVEHQRAIKVFAARLKTWSREVELPAKSSAKTESAIALPVLLGVDAIELLIVRAIRSQSADGLFVTADGLTCIRDPTPTTGVRSILIAAGLSPLLDRVAEVFGQLGYDGGFTEDAGQFTTDAGVVFVDLQRYSKELAVALDPLEVPLGSLALPSTGSVEELVVYGLVGVRQSGVLGKLGYRVGQRGLPRRMRRSILTNAVTVRLIPGTPYAQAYVADWGEPSSRMRISKVCSTIQDFIEDTWARSGDFSAAIAHWEEDLEWIGRASLRKPHA